LIEHSPLESLSKDSAILEPTNVMRHDTLVLLAEDQGVVRRSLVGILSSIGFANVVTATNGTELIRLAHQTTPDVIISDVNMPELDGPQALDQVPSTPCILISGLPFPAAWCESNSERLIACIPKPFRAEEIEVAMRTVQNLLK